MGVDQLPDMMIPRLALLDKGQTMRNVSSLKIPRLTEYRTGPEPGGIRFCVKCGEAIQPGQPWLKEWAEGMEYAVGVHTACAVGAGRHYHIHTCGACGYGTDDRLSAIEHQVSIHSITAPAALAAALR